MERHAVAGVEPLEAELGRILVELPRLGVTKAILFGSMASGTIGETSDLDLLLMAPPRERFTRRLDQDTPGP